jgi:hypothetical protein
MNCDQVFDVLTRGPFPTGHPGDAAVEAHLDQCADCWQIAEALRPAVDLFQEAIPPDEGRDLPGYWGGDRPSPASLAAGCAGRNTYTAQMAVRSAVRQRAQPQPAIHGEQREDLLRILALVTVVTAAALSLACWLRV